MTSTELDTAATTASGTASIESHPEPTTALRTVSTSSDTAATTGPGTASAESDTSPTTASTEPTSTMTQETDTLPSTSAKVSAGNGTIIEPHLETDRPIYFAKSANVQDPL